ncbi:hypothetical protein [Thermotoga sp. KOL6]|uniref:hypothetical protein n=1 Tax=Thermotoga sp. KOL6 TaxID=126741 RepID=UPI000C76F03D|nr:hypothetical protein [Thermotoga sp. KOL6]PLV60318.1 hypothetical protein AS005_03255 [Thermotoga sp. KOL6]
MLFLFFGRKKKNLERDPFYREKGALVVYIKCDRCGEVFRSHLRRGYDFIVDYDSPSTPYKIDKLYVGSKCPNRIRLTATFTSSYKPVSVSIEGGTFITKEEFEESQKQ